MDKKFDFLRDSFKYHRELKENLDRKASFLLTTSGVLFGLSLPNLDHLSFVVLTIGSFLVLFLLVVAIFLPLRPGVEKNFSLICWWGFAKKDLTAYSHELDKVLSDENKIISEYKKEIWNLVEHSIKIKSRLLKWASLLFIASLLIAFILLVYKY